MVEAQEIILGEYDLDVHGTPVHIKVYVSTGFVPIYEVTFPGIGAATKFLLLSLRNELVTMVPIDPLRIETKTYMDELNKKYVEASNVLIDKYLPNPGVETKNVSKRPARYTSLRRDIPIPLSNWNSSYTCREFQKFFSRTAGHPSLPGVSCNLCGSGRATSISVPFPGPEVIFTDPPRLSARSCMPVNPSP